MSEEGPKVEEATPSQVSKEELFGINSDSDLSSSSFYHSNSHLKLRKEILSALEQDILACDVQLSLFVSATNSYRHDSVLKPFPPFLDKTCEKSIEQLRGIINTLPNLETLRSDLKNDDYASKNTLNLVHWVLLGNPMGLRLKTLPESEKVEALNLSNDNESTKATNHLPTHLFEIETTKTKKWKEKLTSSEEYEDSQKIHFGFHGSRTESFHSILSHGLQQHLTTNALFGSGIYFSTDLNMSLSYSKIGHGWTNSLISDKLNCVIMCHILDDKEVKLHTKDPDRNYVDGSEGGKVPEKYLIVRNNDLIQSKYLLVYAKDKKTQSLERQRVNNLLPPWIWDNKFYLLLLGYVLLLASIGISNSPQFKRFLRKKGFISD